MTVALVMAGGRGDRMRASGSSWVKPLVRVRGVPLLERNLTRLLSAGFRDIAVSVAADSAEVRRFVETRGCALARAVEGTVTVLEEREPLGNIGAAQRLQARGGDVLVVYADNLTAVDLPSVVHRHREARAALTTAVHEEPFPIPFGAVEVVDGRILSYREKPVVRVLVSSGIYVLGAQATAEIPVGRRTEVAWLVDRLLAAGALVAAYRHEAPWIDVNDVETLRRAEGLVAAHLPEFEYWHRSPGEGAARLLACTSEHVLLERRLEGAAPERAPWDLPAMCPPPRDLSDDVIGGEANRPIALRPSAEPLTAFDDLDPASGRLARHRIFVTRLAEPRPPSGRNRAWLCRATLERDWPVTSIVLRALAALPDS